jgi:hypothetical protein
MVLSLLVVLALVLVIGLVATPVHVSPGNGSLRCGDPPHTGVLHVASNHETRDLCETAAANRRMQVALTSLGVLVMWIAVALLLSGRFWYPVLLLLGGFLLAAGGALAVVGNLAG